jgi:hypothetical protein
MAPPVQRGGADSSSSGYRGCGQESRNRSDPFSDRDFVLTFGLPAALRSSGGQLPCGFDSHRRHSDRNRQDAPKSATPRGSGFAPDIGSKTRSRQDTPTAAAFRPKTATENATSPPPKDLASAAVVAAWLSLPEANRAGIAAMVKASAGRDVPPLRGNRRERGIGSGR